MVTEAYPLFFGAYALSTTLLLYAHLKGCSVDAYAALQTSVLFLVLAPATVYVYTHAGCRSRASTAFVAAGALALFAWYSGKAPHANIPLVATALPLYVAFTVTLCSPLRGSGARRAGGILARLLVALAAALSLVEVRASITILAAALLLRSVTTLPRNLHSLVEPLALALALPVLYAGKVVTGTSLLILPALTLSSRVAARSGVCPFMKEPHLVKLGSFLLLLPCVLELVGFAERDLLLFLKLLALYVVTTGYSTPRGVKPLAATPAGKAPSIRD